MLVATLVAVLLGSCSGGGGGKAELTVGSPSGTLKPGTTVIAQAPNSTVNADSVKPSCQVLSTDDVAKALGNAVRAPTGTGKFCFWGTAVDGGTSADLTLTIPAANRSAAECAAQRDALPKEATLEQVAGLGTSAVWSWQKVAVLLQGAFIACWQDAVVAIRLTGEKDQAVLKNVASALAQTVRSRL